MAQLYFHYSTMNAGKSTALLQVAHNYKERGMSAKLFTYAGDDRYSVGKITSRIGLQADASLFNKDTNFVDEIYGMMYSGNRPDCVLIDEAQFLTEQNVLELCKLVDEYSVPIMCYGLRTDFQGKLFPGSATLFAHADKLSEMKTLCHCGCKATHVRRIDSDGRVVFDGEQVQIGGNDSYVSLCREHFVNGIIN